MAARTGIRTAKLCPMSSSRAFSKLSVSFDKRKRDFLFVGGGKQHLSFISFFPDRILNIFSFEGP
jgi:hypothetical protein